MDIGTLTGTIELEDKLSGALHLVTGEVDKFAKKYEHTMKGVVVGGALAATGAIAGVTAAIIALGNRGSDVNDVTSTFKHFSGTTLEAEQNLRAMKDGVLGTVDDMDLMKDASKLLAADVHLTADQFSTLTKGAFVLQNQGLGPTKDMLDLVSQALLTGRTRALEMKIGKIDLAKAEKDYAASLGIEKLNKMQKAEAARIAILAQLNKKIEEAGPLQRDFGEQMEAAVVSIKNWGDQLASAIASSTHVTDAVEAIGKAITDSFGGDSQRLINSIVQGVNSFADSVKRYGPVVIQTIADIAHGAMSLGSYLIGTLGPIAKTVFDNVVSLAKAVRSGVEWVVARWEELPTWAKNIATNVGIATVAMWGLDKAVKSVLSNKGAGGGGGGDAVGIIGSIGGAISGLKDLGTIVADAGPKVIMQLKGIGTALQLAFSVGAFARVGAFGKLFGGLGGVFTVLTGQAMALGGALGAIAVPVGIAAGIAGIAAGMWKVIEALKEFSKWKGSWQSFFFQQDTDNWVRRMLPDSIKDRIDKVFKSVKPPAAPKLFNTPDLGPLNIPQGTMVEGMKFKPEWAPSDEDIAASKEQVKAMKELTASAVPLTEAQKNIIEQFHQMGKPTELVAKAFNINKIAAEAYADQLDYATEKLKDDEEMHKEWAKTAHSMTRNVVDEQKKSFEQIAQIRAQAQSEQIASTLAMEESISQASMTETQVAIRNAQLKRDATIRAAEETFEGDVAWREREIEAAKQLYADDVFAAISAEAEKTEDLAQQLAERKRQIEKALKENSFVGQLEKDLAKIPEIITQALVQGGGMKEAATAISSMIAGTIGKSIGKTIGKALGSITGEIGGEIGGAVGSLLGSLVGKLFGPTEYEKRVRAAAQEVKDLTKNLIETHGGMEKLMRDADRVGIKISEALKWKDDPEALKHVIADLDDRLAKLDAGIQKFTSGAAKRLDAFFHSFDKAREGINKNKDLIKVLTDAIAGEAPEEGMGAFEQAMRKQLDSIRHGFLDQLGGTVDDVQAEFDRMGLYAGAAFAENLREHGWEAAIEAAKPMFDQLAQLQSEFGFTVSDSTAQFMNFYNTVKNNEDVLSALQGVTEMIQGSTDALFINQDLFNAFEADAVTGYTRLTERGVDANQALVLMQPTLQALWEAQKKFGFETDESTQALIDQAVQQGIVGDQMRDVNQQILDVLKGIAKALGADIPGAADKAGKAIDDAFKNKEYHVKVQYDQEGYLGGPEMPKEPQYHAAGGTVVAWRPRGTDTVPAMLTPGETVIPAGKSQQPIVIPVTLKAGRETLAKHTVETFIRSGI